MDYRIRLAIILCLLISVAGFLGIAFLFPAYMHARSLEENEMASAKKVASSETSKSRSNIETVLKSDAKILAKLETDLKQNRASAGIFSVITKKGNCKFTSISYAQNGTSSATIVMVGHAPTRDDLLGLKSSLETDFSGAKVELPISELAKSKNIDFSIKLTYLLP